GAMEMIRNHFSAVVPCDSLTPIAEGEAWSFAYDHQPGASTGDALLLISPEASVDSIQVENAALPDVPVYRITWKSGGGGVWLRGAPAGVYRVTLTTQKGSAAPSVSAYRVLAACNVNLGYRDGTDEKAFSSDTVWYRNEHTLLLSTAAAGVPAEDWTPHLIINGYAKDVTFTLVSPAMEGKIVWEASLPVIHRGDVKLEASLSLESGYTLSTGTRTVRVENRAPVVTAGAQNAFRLYYVVGDTKSGIDFNLSGYFSDPDGDPLVYTPDLMPENAGEATVQDGLLHYTPLRATGLTLLTLHARDEHGGHVSTTMQIYQYALSDCLSAWRFALDTQASNNLSGDATAGWTGTLNQPVTLVFALRPETDQNGFYADAQQEWGESVLAGNLTIRLSTLRVNGKLMDNPPDVTVEDQGGRLMASLTLPATTLATEYTLSFTANYGTLSLPNLLAPIEIRFANTPPRLSGLEYTLFTQPIDIGGLPGNYQAVALNAINVASFFADDETPKSLSYALHISGTATCTLNGGQSVYPSGETVVDNIDLAVMEDGICPLALTLLSPGTLNLSITADDGEHNSEAPLTWTVTIVSVFMRTLWYVGLGMLGALLLLALLLVVRYLRLPVFGNVCVSLANVPPETNAIVQPPAEVIPLSFYQKKSVSLLTLMMMYQLAPQPGLDAATADSILLSPARHAHGTDVFVTLLYTRHTSGREIFLDEGVPLMRNKHFVMQREQLVITVRAPEGTGSVRLFFSRQESGDPFML
ncbi:MAG: hypothetical protein LLF96_10245, partial [Eubacteriales bacterium]|nr:hypothetical protein [Eubacteriales bacterium]